MSNMKLMISMCCVVMMAAGFAGCGSTSSDSGPSNYSQNLIDSDLVWAVNGGMDQIYNDNLAGHPVGNQNVLASCPLGGAVQITGSMGYASNTGITTVALNYDMTGCKITKTSGGTTVSLTLTGTMTHTGSFNSATNFKSMNNQSQNLTMTGTAHRSGYNDAAVNNVNCSYSGASTSSSSGGGTVSGSICGNPTVSWSY